MSMSRRALLVLALCSSLAWPTFGVAVDDGPPEGRRVALRGYDPVAYHLDGRPEKGTRRFWYSFDDVVYLFRSSDHREKFAADPERYAPQYEGYCAAGVSKGYKAEPDPEAWLIANGKLYVFQRKDRVPEFRRRIDDVAARANANWSALRRR
jgi:YHS domain-containing protein